LKEKTFLDCLKAQENSNGRPFWKILAQEHNYESGEKLRCAVKNEKKKRGMLDNQDIEKTSYEESDDFINIVCSSKRIRTKEDIIKEFNVDTSIWEIEKFKIKTSEGYRKDRKVKWKVRDGKVLEGDVDDSGKMLVVPLLHLEVRFIKKKNIVQAKDALKTMVDSAKSFSPKYPKIKYQKYSDGCMYEIDIPDIHLGRVSWAEETGKDYDVTIASEAAHSVLDQLIMNAQNYNINKILLPFGNDFFNTDNQRGTTTQGTPQQEETIWQRTFKQGRELAVSLIDKCSVVAPVDVVIVHGNHDTERSLYLGEALECWYHNNPNVKIDNRAVTRKYYDYGKNLIGLTHGQTPKANNLPLIMAVEEPEKWANSKFREWHIGHYHSKANIIHSTKEGIGIVVRVLRSLAVADAWTFNHGFVGAIRAGESFLWHPNNGMIAQFTAMPA